jgi:hypothetical protein
VSDPTIHKRLERIEKKQDEILALLKPKPRAPAPHDPFKNALGLNNHDAPKLEPPVK